MKKLTLNITMPLVLIFAVIAALVYIITIYPNSDPSSPVSNRTPGSSVTEPSVTNELRNEVVETYISLMEQEKYSEMKVLWPEANAGNIKPDPNVKFIPDDKIPQNKPERDFTSFYKYQHDSVISLFGEDAWQKF